MKSHYITNIIIALSLSLFPLISYASMMVFNPDKEEVSVGEMVAVSVLIDTQGDTINAMEGDVVFPASLFSVERIETGSSVVTMWVDEPSSSSPGTIYFSGAMLNGFDGVTSPQHADRQPGLVMRLILQAEQPGSGVFSAKEAKTYRHDGQGTEIDLNPQTTMIRVVQDQTQPSQDQEESEQEPVEELPEDEEVTEASSTSYALDQDTTPPEPFTAEIVMSPELYNGQYVVVFNAQDTGTGIDYYEVREVPRRFSVASVARQHTWERVQSPHVLADQSLTKEVIVKAVDKAGNERVVQLPPENNIPWYRNYIVLLLAILVSSLAFMYLARSRDN